jgi:hypothetical protein
LLLRALEKLTDAKARAGVLSALFAHSLSAFTSLSFVFDRVEQILFVWNKGRIFHHICEVRSPNT